MTTFALHKELDSFLNSRLPQALETLRQMVGINSFTANPQGVDSLGVYTAQVFAGLGFRAEAIPSTNALYGKHLVLTRPARTGNVAIAPRIGLVSHLDTVFPAAEEARHDFRWREAGDRIYGPGVVDIKGGTVLILMILEALQALRPEVFDAVTWVVLLDASEETGGADFARLCVERLQHGALACLIFEPGSWSGEQPRIVVARKGMAVYRIEVEGKAAHAGSAHDRGANAILQMAHVIQRICRMTDYGRNLTYNVGTVAGGTVINRVPHFASASVEMRAFDKDVYDAGMAQLLALNDLSTVSAPSGDFACRVRVQVLNEALPWPRNEATDRLWRVWAEAAAELGHDALPEARAGLSDGNYFWQQLPTLDGLGPAGGNAHCSEQSADGRKEQEYVLRSSFVPKAMLNTLAILRLLEQGP